MPLLENHLIVQIHRTIIDLRLVDSRRTLLASVDSAFLAEIPQDSSQSPSAQIFADLDAMNQEGALGDGSVPLEIWLRNACARARGRRGVEVLEGALRAVIAATGGAPAAPSPGGGGPARFDGAAQRVLFLGASPLELAPLSIEEEARTIRERLQGAPVRFHVVTEQGVQPAHLQGHLLRERPAIVHLSGHGGDGGALLLVDDAKRAVPVSPAALADLFRILGREVVCVVLNACFSEELASAIEPYVPHVVGMSGGIPNGSAIAFASAFYDALGHGETVPTAFEAGCHQLWLLEHPTAHIPCLLVRGGGGGSGPPSAFVLHAPEDDPSWRRLERRLSSLRSRGVLRDFRSGEIGDARGARSLAEADLRIILVSAHLLAPARADALRRALVRPKTGRARTIPILLHACAWDDSPFVHLGGALLHGKPISIWDSQENAWDEVEDALRAACAPR